MKKGIQLLIIFIAFIDFISCKQEEATGELIRELKLELDFSEYSSLPVNSEPYANKYFSPQHEAKNFLPAWLIKKYFSAKDGSVAVINYDYINYDKPIDLISLSGNEVYKISNQDYKYAWNDIVADFYTPSKSPQEYVPQLLNQLSRAEEGDYRVVEFNYSPIEATILNDQQTSIFVENFSGPNARDWGLVNSPVWFNKIMEGGGRGWSHLFNKVPSTPNIFSYNRTAGIDSWLVTSSPIDMIEGKGFEMALDFGWGYSQADRMFNFHVLVSENFDGVDPRNAQWTDITDEFTFTLNDNSKVGMKETEKIKPSSGYPGIRTYKTSNPALFKGKKLYIALRDKLLPVRNDGKVYSSAPMYFVDNVKVTKLVDYAISEESEKRYSVFKYLNGRWIESNELYILQPSDYSEIGQSFLSISNSNLFIPDLLKNKTGGKEGDKKIVVYFTEDNKTNAEDYIFSDGAWMANSPDVITKSDRYLFDSEEIKWQFESQIK